MFITPRILKLLGSIVVMVTTAFLNFDAGRKGFLFPWRNGWQRCFEEPCDSWKVAASRRHCGGGEIARATQPAASHASPTTVLSQAEPEQSLSQNRALLPPVVSGQVFDRGNDRVPNASVGDRK